jgi:hypothetical protein
MRASCAFDGNANASVRRARRPTSGVAARAPRAATPSMAWRETPSAVPGPSFAAFATVCTTYFENRRSSAYVLSQARVQYKSQLLSLNYWRAAGWRLQLAFMPKVARKCGSEELFSEVRLRAEIRGTNATKPLVSAPIRQRPRPDIETPTTEGTHLRRCRVSARRRHPRLTHPGRRHDRGKDGHDSLFLRFCVSAFLRFCVSAFRRFGVSASRFLQIPVLGGSRQPWLRRCLF